MSRRLFLSVSLSLFLVACQTQPTIPVLQPQQQAFSSHVQQQTGIQARLGGSGMLTPLKQTALPVGKIAVKPNSEQPGFAKVSVSLRFPARDSHSAGFKTQALDTSVFTRSHASIDGIGISSPIFADEADEDGLVDHSAGIVTLNFSNVPYGSTRRLQIQMNGTDASLQMSTAFHLHTETSELEVSFRTTPVGDILYDLVVNQACQTGGPPAISLFGNCSAEAVYALSQLNFADLQAFVDSITGVQNTAPNYTYTTHPSFVSAGAIARDLYTNNWNLNALDSQNPDYKDISGTLNFNVEGLIGSDTASIVIRDPVSDAIVAQTNGAGVITGIARGLWMVEAFADGYTADIPSVYQPELPAMVLINPQNPGDAIDLGTITFAVASAPVISSINPSSGSIGTQVTLSGSNFHPSTAGNIVRFGSTQATVISASATELVVSVPNAASGNITVQVGDQTSNGLAFNVLPTVALTAPAADAVLSGTSTLSVSTSSGNAISKVEYFSGATKLGESTSAPYSFDWDTSTATSGAHSLTAKITDAASNEVNSAAISVTVNQLPVIADLTSSISPLYANHPTQLHCDASDAEGTPTISWSTLGGEHGSFSSSTGSAVYWTAPASGGDYTVRCSVSDGTHTVTQDLVLTVVSGTGSVTGNGGLY